MWKTSEENEAQARSEKYIRNINMISKPRGKDNTPNVGKYERGHAFSTGFVEKTQKNMISFAEKTQKNMISSLYSRRSEKNKNMISSMYSRRSKKNKSLSKKVWERECCCRKNWSLSKKSWERDTESKNKSVSKKTCERGDSFSKNKSLSKKTISKRKNTLKTENHSKFVFSEEKNEEESITLKTSCPRSNYKKDAFNSAYISRKIDRDIELMEELGKVSCDFLQSSQSQSVTHTNCNDLLAISQKSAISQHQEPNISLKEILSRTKNILFSYKKKCGELEQNCSFYKKEIQKLNKKLEGMELSKRKSHGERNWSRNKKIDILRDKIRSTCPDKL